MVFVENQDSRDVKVKKPSPRKNTFKVRNRMSRLPNLRQAQNYQRRWEKIQWMGHDGKMDWPKIMYGGWDMVLK